MAKGKIHETSSDEVKILYVPNKSLKEIAFNECQKAGFDVQDNSSVIFATCKDEEEEKKFRDFLLKKYGQINEDGEKRVPFSFGTTIGERTTRKKDFGITNNEEYERDDYEDR